MGKRLSLRGIQTRKNLTIKALVLLLYMSYPSLARQAFVLWNCISIKTVYERGKIQWLVIVGNTYAMLRKGAWAADASNY